MSNQHNRSKPKKENEASSSTIGKVLMAGGAAAIGFLASQLWNDYRAQQTQNQEASSSQPPLQRRGQSREGQHRGGTSGIGQYREGSSREGQTQNQEASLSQPPLRQRGQSREGQHRGGTSGIGQYREGSSREGQTQNQEASLSQPPLRQRGQSREGQHRGGTSGIGQYREGSSRRQPREGQTQNQEASTSEDRFGALRPRVQSWEGQHRGGRFSTGNACCPCPDRCSSREQPREGQTQNHEESSSQPPLRQRGQSREGQYSGGTSGVEQYPRILYGRTQNQEASSSQRPYAAIRRRGQSREGQHRGVRFRDGSSRDQRGGEVRIGGHSNGDYQQMKPDGKGKSCKHDNIKAMKENRDTVSNTDVPDEMKCIVCLDNPREVILMPCNHVCLCADCVEQIGRKCPICRKHVRDLQAVYLS